MSQVISEVDRLKERRLKSRTQERQIDREANHVQWRNSGTAGLSLIARVVGMAVLPVALIWTAFAAMITLAFRAVGRIFQVLGKLVGGTHVDTGLFHPEKDDDRKHEPVKGK